MTARMGRGVCAFAPAKINLTLHITGQREDGYHLLDSLVGFASQGDFVTMGSGNGLSLITEGDEAGAVPDGPDNLVLSAAALLGAKDTAIRLQKNLPVASGMGGGSADAAATYRGLLVRDDDLTERMLSWDDAVFRKHAEKLLTLGADVPMCLLSKPARARGIGEKIVFVEMPKLPMVLINPRVGVSTPDVFKLLGTKDNPPMPDELPIFDTAETLIQWLATMRNDLEAPAAQLCPQITSVLKILNDEEGCALARMSGSGASCFGLFHTKEEAKLATYRLREAYPDWWITGGFIGDQSEFASPTISGSG